MEVNVCSPAVWTRAVELFGSEDKALRWLHTPLSELAEHTPEETLSADPSSSTVDEILDRIEYGVFG